MQPLSSPEAVVARASSPAVATAADAQHLLRPILRSGSGVFGSNQRLVDAVTTPLLLKTVVAGRLKPKQLVTHHFTLAEILSAYATFGNAGKERALKVMVTNP